MNESARFMFSFVAQYNKRPTAEGKQMMIDFARTCLTELEYKVFLCEIERGLV